MTARIVLFCNAQLGPDAACGERLFTPYEDMIDARAWAVRRAGWAYRADGQGEQDLCPRHGASRRIPLPPAGDAHE